MSASSSIFIITVLSFLFIFVSGFWLSRRGKPYNTLMITTHKLLALGTGGYLAYFVFSLIKVEHLSTMGYFVVFVTILMFLGLAACGGLLSSEKQSSAVVLSMHKYLPFLTVVSTLLLIFIVS